MRDVWLRVAANLVKCNAHYRGMAQLWQLQEVDARDLRTRIANRATRPIFHMVSGRRLYDHPSRLDRGYVLDKHRQFHLDHQTPPQQILRDLKQAIDPKKRLRKRPRRSSKRTSRAAVAADPVLYTLRKFSWPHWHG